MGDCMHLVEDAGRLPDNPVHFGLMEQDTSGVQYRNAVPGRVKMLGHSGYNACLEDWCGAYMLVQACLVGLAGACQQA